jgi:type II secretory pathway component PulJ
VYPRRVDTIGFTLIGIVVPLVYLALLVGAIVVVVRVVQSILRIAAAMERIATTLEKRPTE